MKLQQCPQCKHDVPVLPNGKLMSHVLGKHGNIECTPQGAVVLTTIAPNGVSLGRN